jgi:hypothetical protein
VYQLLIDFKKAYDSVRREVLFNILIEFGNPMKLKLVHLTKGKNVTLVWVPGNRR